MDGKLELLSHVPLFSGLDRAGLEQVGRLTDEIDLPAGRELLHEGSLPHEFFLIVDGTVVIDRDGERVSTLGPGDYLGEIALLDGGRRSATATAETDVRLLVLGSREFHSLLNEFPDVRVAVLRTLAGRVRQAENIDE
ncbi:MAG: cyclic nucleotide-binding domain-containing protein [Actinomycetes bacterium]